MKTINTQCPACHTPQWDIFTICPCCGHDTGGEAICIGCRKTVRQVDYWRNGNHCPNCDPQASRDLAKIGKVHSRTTYTYVFKAGKGCWDWPTGWWLLRGKAGFNEEGYHIQNTWGRGWQLGIRFPKLSLQKSFVIQGVFQSKDIVKGHYGLVFGAKNKNFRFLINESGQFCAHRNYDVNNHEISIAGKHKGIVDGWYTLPAPSQLKDGQSVSLEVFYNSRRQSVNYFVNGSKIGFSYHPRFPKRKFFFGFETAGKGSTLICDSLTLQNVDDSYLH